MKPLVCVLIPAYNDAQRLAHTLTGVASVSESFDLVIVDDGSLVPIDLPRWLGAHQVHTLRHFPNRGIEAALNAGVEFALEQGYKYIARLDAGDTSLPGRYAVQAAFLEANPRCAAVGCAAEVVDLDGRLIFLHSPPLTNSGIRAAMRYSNCLFHSTLMIRGDVLRELGGYTDKFPAAEDYEMLLRFASRYELGCIADALVRYDGASEGISHKRRLRQLKSRMRLQIRYFSGASLHSYLGLATSMVMFMLPQSFVRLVKSSLGRSFL